MQAHECPHHEAPAHRFSVAEANALIPRLQLLVPAIQARHAKLREEVARLSPEEQETWSESAREHPTLGPLVRDLRTMLGTLEEIGVVFQGFQLGLIDFPSELDGKPILLCWQYGESEVEWYHDLEAGFQGRQRLPHRPPPRYD